MSQTDEKAEDDRFKTSTHYRFWLLGNQTKIDNLRKARIAESVNKMAALYGDNPKNKKKIDKLYALKYDEYCEILLYWQIHMITAIFNYYHKVQPYVVGTALTYFKRYYLSNSNMIETDAQAMAMTCIFLASKSEQAGMQIKDIARLGKIPAERIINNEILLLNGIKFHLKVWQPFRPLRV